MKTWHKVEMMEVYGSGAGYLGTPANKFVTVRGVGMSRSIKTATRLANVAVAKAAQAATEQAVYVPVVTITRIWRGAVLIAEIK